MSNPSRSPPRRLSTGGAFPIRFTQAWWRYEGDRAVVFVRDPHTGRETTLGTFPWEEWRDKCSIAKEDWVMSFLNKPVPSVSLEGDVGPAVLMDLAGRYPALVEYMAAVAYPDGSARRTATLMLLVDPDGLKGCLNDRQEGRSLWVTSDTVEGVFAALEAGLTSPRPNWRKSSMPAPSAGRRK